MYGSLSTVIKMYARMYGSLLWVLCSYILIWKRPA